MGRQHLLLGGGGALVAALAFVLFAFPGCSDSTTDGYEASAFYPPRIDPLVLDLSKALPPVDVHPAGMLNESIAQIAGRGGKLGPPALVSEADWAGIREALLDLFGTPAAPKVEVAGAAIFGLTPDKLAAGSRVYRLQCAQCHGMTG